MSDPALRDAAFFGGAALCAGLGWWLGWVLGRRIPPLAIPILAAWAGLFLWLQAVATGWESLGVAIVQAFVGLPTGISFVAGAAGGLLRRRRERREAARKTVNAEN